MPSTLGTGGLGTDFSLVLEGLAVTSILFLLRLCGGIGRRAGLKIQCPQGRESSSLSGATNLFGLTFNIIGAPFSWRRLQETPSILWRDGL